MDVLGSMPSSIPDAIAIEVVVLLCCCRMPLGVSVNVCDCFGVSVVVSGYVPRIIPTGHPSMILVLIRRFPFWGGTVSFFVGRDTKGIADSQ